MIQRDFFLVCGAQPNRLSQQQISTVCVLMISSTKFQIENEMIATK